MPRLHHSLFHDLQKPLHSAEKDIIQSLLRCRGPEKYMQVLRLSVRRNNFIVQALNNS